MCPRNVPTFLQFKPRSSWLVAQFPTFAFYSSKKFSTESPERRSDALGFANARLDLLDRLRSDAGVGNRTVTVGRTHQKAAALPSACRGVQNANCLTIQYSRSITQMSLWYLATER